MTLNIDDYIFWDEQKKYSFENYSFILPDISIGNVGQLAVDLLLNNLEVENLGRIVHSCFFPFVGGDPFHLESRRLTSSCEIYECKEKRFLILQIRSRVFPNKKADFRHLIIQFIKKFNFQQTILVASSSSEYFAAEQLQRVPLHYLLTNKFPDENVFNQLNWKKFSLPNNVDTSLVKPVPGSFISSSLLRICEEEKIPFVILICVCSEGYNYPEALHIVNCMNSWLSLKQEKDSDQISWEMPVSWKMPYGSAAPHSIY